MTREVLMGQVELRGIIWSTSIVGQKLGTAVRPGFRTVCPWLDHLTFSCKPDDVMNVCRRNDRIIEVSFAVSHVPSYPLDPQRTASQAANRIPSSGCSQAVEEDGDDGAVNHRVALGMTPST